MVSAVDQETHCPGPASMSSTHKPLSVYTHFSSYLHWNMSARIVTAVLSYWVAIFHWNWYTWWHFQPCNWWKKIKKWIWS